MEISVLGCHGAQLPGYNTTSFLLGRNILVDAGTVTSSLSLEEQTAIDYIFVTHAHLDHVKDIAFLADNLLGRKKNPVEIITTQGIIDILRANLFNNIIWPDFSEIPSKEAPVIAFQAIDPGRWYSIGSMTILAIPVHHIVETVAFVIRYGGGSVIFVGDTGPTDDIWKVANELEDLKAIFVETSFPDDMKDIASVAGHFTPAIFHHELEKLTSLDSVTIYLYHLKPQYYNLIENQVNSISRNNVKILREGQIIDV
ncbi:MAG: 3',5'-cyclic-nucleotide phosphodiesterase [Deltaproteobacteria bacterium]|nr:3',5'-cyclic-nucleotide phosphodiesterase [Deltaproteobacteria bacterium]